MGAICSNLYVVPNRHGIVSAIDPDAGAARAPGEQVGSLGYVIGAAVDMQART